MEADTNRCCFSLENGYERCFTFCIRFSSRLGWRGSVSLLMNALIFSMTPLLCLTSYTYSRSTASSQSLITSLLYTQQPCMLDKPYFFGRHLQFHELSLAAEHVPRSMNLHKAHSWSLGLETHNRFWSKHFSWCRHAGRSSVCLCNFRVCTSLLEHKASTGSSLQKHTLIQAQSLWNLGATLFPGGLICIQSDWSSRFSLTCLNAVYLRPVFPAALHRTSKICDLWACSLNEMKGVKRQRNSHKITLNINILHVNTQHRDTNVASCL